MIGPRPTWEIVIQVLLFGSGQQKSRKVFTNSAIQHGVVLTLGLNYSGPNIDDIFLYSSAITRCFIVIHFLFFYSFFSVADEIV